MKITTKFYRIVLNLAVWHLKPYYVERKMMDKTYREWGFLFFKYIIG